MITNKSIGKTLLLDISIKVVNGCSIFFSYFTETIGQIEKLHRLKAQFPIPKGSRKLNVPSALYCIQGKR